MQDKKESAIVIGGINNTDDSWIVFDDDGHFRHEVKYSCGGKKVHLHFTITELADSNKDPNNLFFDFELDCSCNNQHKSKDNVAVGEEWSCSVDTNGMSDTTFNLHITSTHGDVDGDMMVHMISETNAS